MPGTWQTISKRKKEEQSSRIPQAWLLPDSSKPAADVNNVLDVPRKCGLLNEQELNITEAYDATALVERLSKGQMKSVDVVKAFCKVHWTLIMKTGKQRLIPPMNTEGSNSSPTDQLPH
jgi:amidase